jgi:hypothetical protein
LEYEFCDLAYRRSNLGPGSMTVMMGCLQKFCHRSAVLDNDFPEPEERHNWIALHLP